MQAALLSETRELVSVDPATLLRNVTGLLLERADEAARTIATEDERARVEALVADALECGAKVVAGGGRPALGLPGWFHEPTVLAGEPSNAAIREEEIVGLVVTVARIENDTDGIRRANDSRYGLGASVWTRHHERGRRVGEQLRAGSVWVNDHAYSYGLGQAPWGGTKESGLGRTHSRHGLYAMSQLTFTDADRGWIRPPWWFPYSGGVLDGFSGALGVLYGRGAAERVAALRRHRRGLAQLARRAVAR